MQEHYIFIHATVPCKVYAYLSKGPEHFLPPGEVTRVSSVAGICLSVLRTRALPASERCAKRRFQRQAYTYLSKGAELFLLLLGEVSRVSSVPSIIYLSKDQNITCLRKSANRYFSAGVILDTQRCSLPTPNTPKFLG